MWQQDTRLGSNKVYFRRNTGDKDEEEE
jgi:hypothetical protein